MKKTEANHRQSRVHSYRNLGVSLQRCGGCGGHTSEQEIDLGSSGTDKTLISLLVASQR